MSYFRVCPSCGCNIDPGEICDCKRARSRQTAPEAQDFTRDSPRMVYHACRRHAGPIKIRPIDGHVPGARS